MSKLHCYTQHSKHINLYKIVQLLNYLFTKQNLKNSLDPKILRIDVVNYWTRKGRHDILMCFKFSRGFCDKESKLKMILKSSWSNRVSEKEIFFFNLSFRFRHDGIGNRIDCYIGLTFAKLGFRRPTGPRILDPLFRIFFSVFKSLEWTWFFRNGHFNYTIFFILFIYPKQQKM